MRFLHAGATAPFKCTLTRMFLTKMGMSLPQDWMAKSRSIRLYVKRVFISDEFDEARPECAFSLCVLAWPLPDCSVTV